MIYLDHNATTPVDPRVREAMRPFFSDTFGNPSSPHAAGRAARAAVEAARASTASLIGAEPEEIIFTSGGTESIDTAIRGALAAQPGKRHIVTSTVEHSATRALCLRLEKEGFEVTWLGVDAHGLPDPASFAASLRPDTAIASFLWANNETGVVLPLEELAAAADERRVVFHADAVQMAGKMPVDLRRVRAHLLSVSAHKFGGPKGVGALFVRSGLGLPAFLPGAQENTRRGGTENVPGIVGLGVAADLVAQTLTEETPRLAGLRDDFELGVRLVFPEARFHGERVPRLPNTSASALPGLDAREMLACLDRLGVACSVGSACSGGGPSHVLAAMAVPESILRSTLRFSFGRTNTRADVGAALEALSAAIRRVGARD